MPLMSQNEKRWLLMWAKALMAAGIVWYLLSSGAVEWAKVQALRQHQWAVCGVIAIFLLMYAISVVRWRMLLDCQDIPLTARDASEATLFSLFLNCILPGGGFGGDTYRVAYVACRFPVNGPAGVISVLVDRGLGFYALVSVAAGVGLVHLQVVASDPVLLALSVCAGVVTVGGAVLAIIVGFCASNSLRIEGAEPAMTSVGGFRRMVGAIRQAARLYARAPFTMVGALGLSLVIQLLAISAVIILGTTMGFADMSATDYVFAAPWGWLANLFPLTLGGIGVGEIAFEKICHLLKGGDATAGYATIFLGYRVLATGATFPGLLFWLLSAQSWKRFTQPCDVMEGVRE